MRDDKSFEVTGTWTRWSEYELADGYVVPATGATPVEYDPWERFRANAGRYRTIDQPYTALLELNRALTDLKDQGVKPTQQLSYYIDGDPIRGPQNQADRTILDWCNTNGLLGLVPVLCGYVRLPAQTEPDLPDHSMGDAKTAFEGRRIFRQVEHIKSGGNWTSRLRTESISSPLPHHLPEPLVQWFDPLFHVYEDKALADIRNYFLPNPARHGREAAPFFPPRPGSREFWGSYIEEGAEIARWAQRFAEAIDAVSAWRSDQGDADARGVTRAYQGLGGLAQSAVPSFRFNAPRNALEEVRVSSGLLSSFALMFLWDRADGRRALHCQNCQAYFVSNESRARYCRPTCRNTAQSRRYRAGRPTAEREPQNPIRIPTRKNR